jgi:hypothetical protein
MMQQIKQTTGKLKYIFPSHGDRLLVSFGMMLPILFVVSINWRLGCVMLATFVVYATSYYVWHYRCKRGAMHFQLARVCMRVALSSVVIWLLMMVGAVWSIIYGLVQQ